MQVLDNPVVRAEARSGSPSRRWRFAVVPLALIAVIVSARLIFGGGSAAEIDPDLMHTVTRGELVVSVTEQGTLESSNNTEIKCKVRGDNTIIWVVESGTVVEPGDELVRLETLLIDEEINERKKFAHLAESVAARSKADVANAKLAIREYLEGQFVSQMAALKKVKAVAEARLAGAQNMLDHAKMMLDSGYANALDVEEREFEVSQFDLEVQLIRTRLEVLEKFTKREQLALLNGNLAAARAQYEADREREYADKQRLERAQEEFQFCTVRAERSGMVIYPTAQAWEQAPNIEEGATVHKDQVLLLMPDLSDMQVKVGIHESIVDRVKTGMEAIVTLPDRTLDGKVISVASVAKPAGWWTGNVVKYDTVVDLPTNEKLKPGMSVEVEVILDRYADVLRIPTSAVVQTKTGYACWVDTPRGVKRRPLQLGDSGNMYIVVEGGLTEGEVVVLDPLAHVAEAQTEAAAGFGEMPGESTDLNQL